MLAMNIYKALLGRVHFIGIGGIGMSAIARLLCQMGCNVSGSDSAEGQNTKALEQIGARVFYGHNPQNVEGASVVIFSSAIAADNCEVLEAKRLGTATSHRSAMLAMLMKHRFSVGVSGSHGKTTTTALIYNLLEFYGYNPSFALGGIEASVGTNAKLGAGEIFVSEADESDGSFLNLKPDVAVVTNIGREHLQFYGTFENCISSFEKFVAEVPFYGCAIASSDNDYTRDLASRTTSRVITFGLHENANVRATNITHGSEGSVYDVEVKIPWLASFAKKAVRLPLLGVHNVHNSLAGFALLTFLGQEFEASCFAQFKGVKRRCELVGKYMGASIIDDYAVHPNEIKAVLSALKSHSRVGEIIVVLQPHRYSRLRCLFDEFLKALKGADKVYVAEVFSAWEEPIDGVSGLRLAEEGGHTYVDSYATLKASLQQHLTPQDLVLFLGAGSITSWCHKLVSEA
jgi:UDP-N-acetylmuramate--alanine ligase